MKTVFLEAHNLKNMASGFGVFNHHLINAYYKSEINDLSITINAKDTLKYKKEFGDYFKYSEYSFLQKSKFLGVNKKYDVWHSLNQCIKIEPVQKPGKYITTVHDVNFMEGVRGKSDLRRTNVFLKKLKRTDLIVYISEYAKMQTHQYFDTSGIEERIIYNGNPITEFLNTENYRPEYGLDRPFFYSIGAFIPKKNFESLIMMINELPDYNLIISGSNENTYGNKIKNLIKELKLEKRVFLTGRVSETEKQFYLKNCDAFFFPSVGEGFGLPPIEAMRFGKPVFLANRTSLPEVGGEIAFYWDNFDPIEMKEKLIDGLNKFSEKPDWYREKLIERAKIFNWINAAEAYLECYRN